MAWPVKYRDRAAGGLACTLVNPAGTLTSLPHPASPDNDKKAGLAFERAPVVLSQLKGAYFSRGAVSRVESVRPASSAGRDSLK